MAEKWYKIFAPKIFNQEEIGQTTTSEQEKILGRTIEIPLSEIFRDYKKNNVMIKLKVTDFKDNKAMTSIVLYSLIKTYLIRLVRKGILGIDSVEDVETKDGKKARIKVLAITQSSTTNLQKNLIRKGISEYVQKQLPDYEWDAFMLSLITGKFQVELKKRLKKFYPIKYIEVRKAEVF